MILSVTTYTLHTCFNKSATSHGYLFFTVFCYVLRFGFSNISFCFVFFRFLFLLLCSLAYLFVLIYLLYHLFFCCCWFSSTFNLCSISLSSKVPWCNLKCRVFNLLVLLAFLLLYSSPIDVLLLQFSFSLSLVWVSAAITFWWF